MKALILLTLIVLGAPGQFIFAEGVEQYEDCSKDLILSYFPEDIVNSVLGSYRVPEDSWASINAALNAQDEIILSKIEEKTSQMDPNPLKDPSLKGEAINLFRETLYESFGEVMKEHGVESEAQIQAMMDQIQFKKAEHFKKCIDKRKVDSLLIHGENTQ